MSDPRIITLSTGVCLRVKKIPSILLADIVAKHNPSRPTPPRIFIVSKGREEENPDDPEYKERMGGWQAGLVAAVNNAFLLFGTSVESIPNTIESLESDRWAQRIRLLGLETTDNPDARYLAWLKYVGGTEDSDIQLMLSEVGRLSGVAEADVQTAVDQFRR